MKKISKAMTVVIAVSIFAGPATAGQIYYQLNDEPINSYRSSPILENTSQVTTNGTYVQRGSWTLEKSFSGLGDLSGFTDLAATLTFTWRDDAWLWTVGNGTTSQSHMKTETGDKTDPLGWSGNPGAYHDFAIVSLDGIQVLSNVEVGTASSLDPVIYQYSLTLTDLSLLNDGILTYLITAGVTGPSYSRCDFIVDSVALEITGTPVPVPATVWLLGSGLVALIGVRRKRTA